MTSFRLYAYFTIIVLILIIFYCLILSGIDPYPLLPTHATRDPGKHETYSIPQRRKISSRKEEEYVDYKSNPRLYEVKQSLVHDIRSFKSHLVGHLMHEEKVFASKKAMHADEVGDRDSTRVNRLHKQLVCKIPFQGMDPSFPGIVQHGVYRVLPAKKLGSLIQSLTGASRSRSCGLVSSAASLSGSLNGRVIDSHDIVLRFNGAPVDNDTIPDTGTRTTIRILNSQFFTSDSFDITDTRYDGQILILWDNFTSGNEPDASQLYRMYVNHRDNYPDVRMYILNPIAVRQAVRILVKSSTNRLPSQIEPSSGFIGLLLLVRFCSTVTAYELIPSIRMSTRCRYYGRQETPFNCMFSGSRASEKLFALRMNHASDYNVIVRGRSDYAGCVTG